MRIAEDLRLNTDINGVVIIMLGWMRIAYRLGIKAYALLIIAYGLLIIA